VLNGNEEGRMGEKKKGKKGPPRFRRLFADFGKEGGGGISADVTTSLSVGKRAVFKTKKRGRGGERETTHVGG